MRLLLLFLPLLIPSQASAEIFVCKNGANKITYQDEPCLDTTIRKLKNIPDAPIEDQILAQERLNKAQTLSLQRAQLAEAERQQQDKVKREYQAIAIEKRKLELLEKQSLESEQAMVPQWIVGGTNGFGVNRFNPYRYGTGRLGQGPYKNNPFGNVGKHRDQSHRSDSRTANRYWQKQDRK